ncbi:MAG: hypothetical protein Q9M91_06705 [Candidatus Dojkabacteria bacterium]|nr:hypothetical protein [Candidatus Dojkabacteria bacterium]MDQ7021486.1 hypothetical protein [Candidatus Dojkabacteria bacterium]
MYPKITLKIEGETPTVLYEPEDGMSRELITEHENLKDLFKSYVIRLGLSSDEAISFEEIARLATEGDGRFIESIPSVNLDSNGFDLKKALARQKEDIDNNRIDISQYSDDSSKEVLNELQRNENLDALACLIDTAYNIIIAKTIHLASELGILKIYLEDHDKNIRLVERFTSELTKEEIDFEIS